VTLSLQHERIHGRNQRTAAYSWEYSLACIWGIIQEVGLAWAASTRVRESTTYRRTAVRSRNQDEETDLQGRRESEMMAEGGR